MHGIKKDRAQDKKGPMCSLRGGGEWSGTVDPLLLRILEVADPLGPLRLLRPMRGGRGWLGTVDALLPRILKV